MHHCLCGNTYVHLTTHPIIARILDKGQKYEKLKDDQQFESIADSQEGDIFPQNLIRLVSG